MLHQKDRGAEFPESGDDLKNLVDKNRGQAQRGLIQDQQARIGDHGADHHQHLLLTTGKCACQLPDPLLEAREDLKKSIDLFLDLLGIVLAQKRAHLNVLHDG